MKNTTFVVLHKCEFVYILVLVFHRILDFKTGQHFYASPFFIPRPQQLPYSFIPVITKRIII